MIDVKSLTDIFKKKSFVGCDFGGRCTKIVKLEKKEARIVLKGSGVVRVPDTLDINSRKKALRAFLYEHKLIHDGEVTVNIEDSSLLVRRMDLPKMPDRDLKTAIRWNFRESVNGSVDDFSVSYLLINGAGEAEKFALTAFCVSNKAVDSIRAFTKALGLKLGAVEPNATALLATFSSSIGWEKNKFSAILDMGDTLSNFIVVGNDCLLFSRPFTKLSGRALVGNIAKKLVIDEISAEEKLKKYLTNIDESFENSGEIAEIVSEFLSRLIIEVQRSIDAFCIMYKKDRIDKLYLCGGGICLPDIIGRLASGLGVPVEPLNPFLNIEGAEGAAKMETAPLYAVAVGLALPGD